MSKVQEVIELVKGLTVLELAELVKALREFGVSAAAPVAVAAAPTAVADDEVAENRLNLT